jgi:hypothetical protein
LIAVNVCEYGTPTVPLLSAVVVIVSRGLEMVSVTVAVTTCDGVPASVT